MVLFSDMKQTEPNKTILWMEYYAYSFICEKKHPSKYPEYHKVWETGKGAIGQTILA